MKKPRAKIVEYIGGTPPGVAEVIREALGRARRNETLAIAIIEVRREGEILRSIGGDEEGMQSALLAGTVHLQRDLTEPE